MRNLIGLLFVFSICNISFTEDFKYQIDRDTWKIDLLLETCPQKLKEAISHITDQKAYKPYVAVLPETIGYQYFKVVFQKKLSKNILSPVDSFATEFRYWRSNDGDEEDQCSRVEFEDFDI